MPNPLPHFPYGSFWFLVCPFSIQIFLYILVVDCHLSDVGNPIACHRFRLQITARSCEGVFRRAGMWRRWEFRGECFGSIGICRPGEQPRKRSIISAFGKALSASFTHGSGCTRHHRQRSAHIIWSCSYATSCITARHHHIDISERSRHDDLLPTTVSRAEQTDVT